MFNKLIFGLLRRSHKLQDRLQLIIEKVEISGVNDAETSALILEQMFQYADTNAKLLARVSTMSEQDMDLDDLNVKVERLLKLFESNVGAIACSDKMKTVPIRGRSDISTESIAALYATGLSNKEIGDRLGITGAAVADRLKKSGQYVGKKADYGKKRRTV